MGFFQNTCKPEGLDGKIMVTTMNIGGHAALAKWGLSHLALERDLNILEIGCGGGANVAQLLKRCPNGKVTGVDYSEVSVEKSKKVNEKAIRAGRCNIQCENKENEIVASLKQAGFSSVITHRNPEKHWICFSAEK